MTVSLVTGANRGLGLATSEALARAGMSVIATGRDVADVERAAAVLRADGLNVQAYPMDVTDDASVAAAAEWVSRRHDTLDVLVNNAGILPEATAAGGHEFADAAVFRATFATNVFGVVAVTEAFLPLLRRSTRGRIVNVSTTMGSLADQDDPSSPYRGLDLPAYRSSKTALNSITISLAKSLAGSDIKVTSVCPGWVQTDLAPGNREHAPLTAEDAAKVVVHAATLPAGSPSGTFIDGTGRVAW